MKLQFVEGWRQSFKWASVQLAGLVAVVSGLIVSNPDFLLGLASAMPTGRLRLIASVGVSVITFGVPWLTRVLTKRKEQCDVE